MGGLTGLKHIMQDVWQGPLIARHVVTYWREPPLLCVCMVAMQYKVRL